MAWSGEAAVYCLLSLLRWALPVLHGLLTLGWLVGAPLAALEENVKLAGGRCMGLSW